VGGAAAPVQFTAGVARAGAPRYTPTHNPRPNPQPYGPKQGGGVVLENFLKMFP
jgi:hypothetical protein